MELIFEWDEDKATRAEQKLMNKKPKPEKIEGDEMLPEYDFSKMKGGVRGKYYKTYRAGHTVQIHKNDGSTETHYFQLEEGAVLLEPDVRNYFPDSESVNHTLRSLIALIPQEKETAEMR